MSTEDKVKNIIGKIEARLEELERFQPYIRNMEFYNSRKKTLQNQLEHFNNELNKLGEIQESSEKTKV